MDEKPKTTFDASQAAQEQKAAPDKEYFSPFQSSSVSDATSTQPSAAGPFTTVESNVPPSVRSGKDVLSGDLVADPPKRPGRVADMPTLPSLTSLNTCVKVVPPPPPAQLQQQQSEGAGESKTLYREVDDDEGAEEITCYQVRVCLGVGGNGGCGRCEAGGFQLQGRLCRCTHVCCTATQQVATQLPPRGGPTFARACCTHRAGPCCLQFSITSAPERPHIASLPCAARMNDKPPTPHRSALLPCLRTCPHRGAVAAR